MADLTQNPLFSFVPEDVVRRQKEASRQAYSGSGYQSLGYGLGRLFGAGDEARAAEVKAAQDREDILAGGLSAYPDSPYKAYSQVAKNLLKRGDTVLAQQYMEQANRFKLMDEDQRMQKEAHKLRMEAGRAAMDKERAFTTPALGPALKAARTFMDEQKMSGQINAVGGGVLPWSGDSDAEAAIQQALASEANKIIGEQKYGKGPKLSYTQALGKAFNLLKNKGIFASTGASVGDNYNFYPDKYKEYLGITQPGGEIDPRVKAFMDANKITDRKEAEDILKKAGKL